MEVLRRSLESESGLNPDVRNHTHSLGKFRSQYRQGGGFFFSGWPSLTLTGWEKIRNMHSPDFRSGQKGLDVTNYDAVIAFYLNKLNAEGL